MNGRNIINILDEMKIYGIESYALIELSDYDRNLISKARQNKKLPVLVRIHCRQL